MEDAPDQLIQTARAAGQGRVPAPRAFAHSDKFFGIVIAQPHPLTNVDEDPGRKVCPVAFWTLVAGSNQPDSSDVEVVPGYIALPAGRSAAKSSARTLMAATTGAQLLGYQ